MILIYMYRLILLFAKIPTTRDAKQTDANFKDIIKIAEDLEDFNKNNSVLLKSAKLFPAWDSL